MERTHDENRCENCTKKGDVKIDDFSGRPHCLDIDVEDGDIICTNFTEEEK